MNACMHGRVVSSGPCLPMWVLCQWERWPVMSGSGQGSKSEKARLPNQNTIRRRRMVLLKTTLETNRTPLLALFFVGAAVSFIFVRFITLCSDRCIFYFCFFYLFQDRGCGRMAVNAWPEPHGRARMAGPHGQAPGMTPFTRPHRAPAIAPKPKARDRKCSLTKSQ